MTDTVALWVFYFIYLFFILRYTGSLKDCITKIQEGLALFQSDVRWNEGRLKTFHCTIYLISETRPWNLFFFFFFRETNHGPLSETFVLIFCIMWGRKDSSLSLLYFCVSVSLLSGFPHLKDVCGFYSNGAGHISVLQCVQWRRGLFPHTDIGKSSRGLDQPAAPLSNQSAEDQWWPGECCCQSRCS